MAAIIKYGRAVAFVSEGRWFSVNIGLAYDLQELTDLLTIPASEPDGDNYIARVLSAKIGTEVVSFNEVPDDGSTPPYGPTAAIRPKPNQIESA